MKLKCVMLCNSACVKGPGSLPPLLRTLLEVLRPCGSACAGLHTPCMLFSTRILPSEAQPCAFRQCKASIAPRSTIGGLKGRWQASRWICRNGFCFSGRMFSSLVSSRIRYCATATQLQHSVAMASLRPAVESVGGMQVWIRVQVHGRVWLLCKGEYGWHKKSVSGGLHALCPLAISLFQNSRTM